MLPSRLSHFLAISLALHATVLVVSHTSRPQRDWLAGPVIVRLVPVPQSVRESRPTGSGKAAPAEKTPATPAMQAATAAEKTLPQQRPPRHSAASPAGAESPPGTGVSPAPPGPQSADTATRMAEREQQLLDSLHAALMPHFSYPLLARRRGWEGIVRVGLRIEANGRLTRLHLVEPSPYDVLNTAAINSLAQLARLPNAGTWLQGSPVDLVVPVEYRLLEG